MVLTGMRLRQAVNLAVGLVDREPLDTLDTLQVDEAAERHAGCARSEAEDLGSLLTVERLERSPPPDNDGVGAGVAVVLRRSAPFVYIDVRGSRDQ